VALPIVPVTTTVAPSGDDDSGHIQAALDSVARMDPVAGFRGAVLLKPGTHRCSKPLVLGASGVVLQGSGSGAGATTIAMTGAPHLCISVGRPVRIERTGKPARITDPYIPSGGSLVHVDNAAAFKIGDPVLVCRPVTAAWGKFMGMHTLVRAGQKQTWLSASGETTAERMIRKIEGNQVTLDIPLSDSLDAKYVNPPGASLVAMRHAGGFRRSGWRTCGSSPRRKRWRSQKNIIKPCD
jgi:hypothetical protein